MVAATVLALGAAVLHAGWNLAVKQSVTDRLLALWGQFLFAGLISGVVLLIAGGMPLSGAPWAVATGAIHVPYCWCLARAYTVGDFSVVYPIARGGGALLAGVGGIALLDDDMSRPAVLALFVVGIGLMLLAGRASAVSVTMAIAVAITIALYTLADAKGVRVSDSRLYPFAVFTSCGAFMTIFGIATGRLGQFRLAMRRARVTIMLSATASLVSYTLVLLAIRLAPVGYVAALRESSVVIAAIVGSRYLGEGQAWRRAVAAAIVLAGLITLVLST